ncbi:MAG TPA: polysaccharide biosynthesis tyrosine autokinase [Ignavibacteriaceae bacterium]|nr:polysaccharide biosynthesis tyrosine autokinase [Ignavibacteriaceae bacterium]
MENFNLEKYLHGNVKTVKDYILLFRNNLKLIIFISVIVVILMAVYAYMQEDVYVTAVTLKITEPNKSVLDPSSPGSGAERLDRFIANEIKVIQNFNTRRNIALALIDSFNNTTNKDLFNLVRAEKEQGSNAHKSPEHLAGVLGGSIWAEQVPGVDVLMISAQSPSAYEAALIANTSAVEYQKVNLAISRAKLTKIREFLEEQSKEKLVDLKKAEDSLMKFQEQGGIVAMEVQSTGLISQLSNLDAQKQATRIELTTSNEVLKQYKFFLRKQDPQLVDYLENQTSQAYISALQEQLAELQVKRDLALSVKSSNIDVSGKVREFDERIAELQQKLNSAISGIKSESFTSNPEQVRELAQKTIEEEIRNSTLSVRLEQLETASRKYESDLRRLPKTSTALSQYQRDRESIQQLFLLINERYQEAVINELSQSGNVYVLDPAGIPGGPAKPNRKLIIIFGLFLGLAVGFGLILIRDYFDDTIKSPEDIEKKNISFLSWVPHFKTNSRSQDYNQDLAALYEQDSPITESFKAIRARIQHSRIEEAFPKLILVTSPAESEGKTFVSLNLAGSYAQSGKRTILIDSDLRRPRMHSVMSVNKQPGLSDYLTKKSKLDEIIRKTRINNLNYITAGSIPSNPTELLESSAMKDFLQEMRDFFDLVIIDSPPIVAVIDAEILGKLVDGTVLVISADKTENRLFEDAVDLIKQNKVSFLGTVLNNFKYKSGYGYYYKYYYNYSKSSDKKGRFRSNKIKT